MTTLRILLAALLLSSIPAGVIPADENSRIESIRAALKERRHADAERDARQLLAEVTASFGPRSVEAAEVLEVLVDALLKGGNGDKPEVLELAEQAVGIAGTIFGPDDLRLAVHLKNLGRVVWQRHDLDRAQQVFEQLLELREKNLGSDHPDVAASLHRLGGLLGQKREFDRAIALLERALKIRKEVFGEESREYADVLSGLAVVLTNMDRLDEAKTMHEKTVGILEKTLGPRHLEVGFALVGLGYVLRDLDDIAGAIAALERALSIEEENLGPDHLILAGTLNYLGSAEGNRGNWNRARSYHQRSLVIREKALGPDHPELAFSLANLGDMLTDLGDHVEAVELQTRAHRILEKAFGPDNPDVAQIDLKIGNAYKQAGNYVDARAHYERGLGTLERFHGPDHPDLIHGLTHLADVLSQLGDFDRAESLYERALRIAGKSIGSEHSIVANIVQSLGDLYRHQHLFAEALNRYERARPIFEATYGPDSSLVAIHLQKIADAHWHLGDYGAAALVNKRSLEIFEQTLGLEHPEAMLAVGNLARLERRAGNLERARELRQQAFESLQKSYGPDHPRVAWSMIELARLHRETGDIGSSVDLALSAEQLLRKHFLRTARSLAEREALSYDSARHSGLDLAISVLAQGTHGIPAPAVAQRIWDELIRSRGLVLDEMASRHRTMIGNGDPEITALIDRLRSARERLAGLVIAGPDPENAANYPDRIAEAQVEKERLERRLAESSREFRETLSRRAIGFADIRSALPRNSALIAYVRFDRVPVPDSEPALPFDPPEPIPWYLAFVLPSSGAEPGVVALGAADEIDRHVHQWKREVGREPTGLPLADSRSEEAYREIGPRLREAIWDPVVRKMQGAKMLFVVPDGAVNMVNLGTLPVDGGGYLTESRVIHYLSTERDLIRGRRSLSPGSGLLAMGGADFNATADAIAAAAADHVASVIHTGDRPAHLASSSPFRSSAPGCGDFARLDFDRLPGSADEVRDVGSMWPESRKQGGNGNGDIVLLTGPGASEEAFKKQAPGRRVLHLATHGFFLADRCESSSNRMRSRTREIGAGAPVFPLIGDNPLLLSGLALAGANSRKEHRGDPDREDGILTAEEIAWLDLSSVDWAVLSACETGVGAILPGEGVLGLRRAFETAGARTLIMSLWKVRDDAAREWMRELYEGRRDGLRTVEAVRNASLAMIERRRAGGKSTHPFYWGAFVAAGDWR